jgi:hypothetical protein
LHTEHDHARPPLIVGQRQDAKLRAEKILVGGIGPRQKAQRRHRRQGRIQAATESRGIFRRQEVLHHLAGMGAVNAYKPHAFQPHAMTILPVRRGEALVKRDVGKKIFQAARRHGFARGQRGVAAQIVPQPHQLLEPGPVEMQIGIAKGCPTRRRGLCLVGFVSGLHDGEVAPAPSKIRKAKAGYDPKGFHHSAPG